MTQIYQKHNSFLELQSKSNPQIISDRILRLKESISSLVLSEADREILNTVCEEVLENGNRASEGPCFKLFPNVMDEIGRLSDEWLPRYFLYRYRYEIFPQKYLLADFPPCLQIEPTSICNYRCVFCYQTDTAFTEKSKGHMGHMPFARFKEFIDQAEGQCEAVTLASRGEPLICPDIERMLRYCEGKFLALKLNTNAWFLDEAKCHAILEAGINTLVFSADAASEPLYSRLRVGGKLDRILNNIRLFQTIRQKHYSASKIITRISGVYLSENQSFDEMQSFWGEIVDQVAFVKYNPWENTYIQPVHDMTTPCSDLWRRMFVWFDGRVNPCDVDYKSTLSVGNAFQKSLKEIWLSESYQKMREHHLNQRRSQLSPCNRCVVI